jgi:hypothetical protein
MQPTPQSNQFILEAFDRNQWCPILQALVHVTDLDALRAFLGYAADDDPELQHGYRLDDSDLARFVAKYQVTFDPGQLDSKDLEISLFRWRRLRETPYLVHTGYELPLLLDGRKKLARMAHAYPPSTFDGEDRFERWVAEGFLHREEVVEPFDPPAPSYLGHRTVFYTPKGEEWRIPASKLIWEAAGKSGGWNEYFERLEGMLYGYEDWQNDWWINVGLDRGGFGGVRLCCAVDSERLAWIKSAGFRALPPAAKPILRIATCDATAEVGLNDLMVGDPDSATLVRFSVLGHAFMSLVDDLSRGGPWDLPSDRVPELNRNLRGSVEIVARQTTDRRPAADERTQ